MAIPSSKRVLMAALCSGMLTGQVVAATLALAYGNPVSRDELLPAIMIVLLYGSFFGMAPGAVAALTAAALLRIAGNHWICLRGLAAWLATGVLVGVGVGAVLFVPDGAAWGVVGTAVAGGGSSMLFRFLVSPQ